jgi:pyrroline-5-carboxylate reductase
MKRFGILGCGNMGSAIIRALALCEEQTYELIVFDTDHERAAMIAFEVSGTVAGSIGELVQHSDITLLAVKPQILPQLYPLLRSDEQHRYISIAAGVSLATLSEQLNSTQIVRFMPNIAASVAQAVTAVAAHQLADPAFTREAVQAARSFGTVSELPEHLFPAFTGISGSAIAFFYQFLHAVALGGTREGIAYQESVRIAAQTFSGAVELLNHSGADPIALLTSVISAGGTTIAGIQELERGALNSTVISAVQATAGRAIELSRPAEQQNT